MREVISAPSEYHQERLDRTASFVRSDGFVFAAQLPKKHFPTAPDGSIDATRLIPIVPYLHASHLDHTQTGRVFTPDSRVIPITKASFNIAEHDPEVVMGWFLGNAEEAMALINPSMAGPRYRQIKNTHDGIHATKVSRHALSLAKTVLSPIHDRDVLQAAAAAYVLHDIGNLVGREDHPCFSVRLARLLYPNLQMTNKQAKIFDQTILLHDGDDIEKLFESWGPVHARIAVAELAKFGPAALALLIADKAGDVGLSRLPTGKNVPSKDYQNIHRVINLFWETDFLGFMNFDSELEMRFAFGRRITPEQAAQIPAFVTETDDGNIERKVAKTIKDTKRSEPMTRYEHLLRGFWSEYYPRMMLAVMASFAMNPLLEETRIVMYNVDIESGDKDKIFTFKRDRLARDMWDVYRTMVPLAQRQKPEFKQYANFAHIERVDVYS